MKKPNFFNPSLNQPQQSPQTNHQLLLQRGGSEPLSKQQAFAQSANIFFTDFSQLKRISSHNDWYSSLESPFQAYYDSQKQEVKDVKMDSKRTYDEAEILSDDVEITASSDNKGNAEGENKEGSEPSSQDSTKTSSQDSTMPSSQEQLDHLLRSFSELIL